MGNLKYGQYDEETALEEKEELDASGAQFMKLKVGRNIIRILPPPKGQRTPWKTVFQHFVDIAGKRQSIVCARLEKRQPCLVCAKIDQLRKSKSPADQEMANALFARRRTFCNVIDRSNEAKGPQVLGIGKTIHETLVGLRADAEAGGDYLNPEDGFDVIITRVGTGKNDTKYTVALARKSTPLNREGNEDIMQEWIDNQHELERFAKLPAATEVKQLLSGEEVDEDAPNEDEDEDAEEAPPPKKKKTYAAAPPPPPPAKKKKRRTLDEDAIEAEGYPSPDEDADE